MIVMSPVMKAEIPDTIPMSIVKNRAGLVLMSANMVSPADIELYKKRANNVPMKNNIGIATAKPNEHQPNLVFGRMLIFT